MRNNTNYRRSSRRTRSRLSFFLICLLILVALGVVLFIALKSTQSTPAPEPTTPDTTQDNSTDAPEPTDEETSSEPSSSESESPNNTPSQFEGENPNRLEALTGSIAYKDVNGTTLEIAAIINQYLEAPGTCALNLYNSTNESVLSAEMDARADITTSVCDTFLLSVANLPAGNYTIKIQLSGDNKTGEIIDEVTIE